MTIYRRDSKDGPRRVVDFQVSGTRVNHILTGARNKREAQAAEARLKKEYRARLNRAGAVTRITVEGAVQRYMVERLKPRTRNPDGLAPHLGYLGLV